MLKKISRVFREKRGNLVAWVIITAMVAIIAVGVVSQWKGPIKDLNSAATARLIVTS